MKKRLRVLALMLVLVMALGLVGCGGSSDTSDSSADSTASSDSASKPADSTSTGNSTHEKVEITYGGSHASGTGYQYCVALSGIVNKYSEWLTITPMTTVGGAENMHLVEAGEIEVGSGSGVLMYFAYNGMGEWEGAPVENTTLLLSMYPDYFHLMVPADSDINTIEDIKGKRISINTKSAGANQASLLYFNALGIDLETYIEPYYLSTSESGAALQEGTIDGMIYIGGFGGSVPMEVAASQRGLKLIPFTEEQIEILCETYGMIQPATIPAGTYEGIDYDVRTVGGYCPLCVGAGVPEDVVYEIVRILDEHHDEFAETMPQAVHSTMENTWEAWGNSFVKIHPGTEKLLKEKGLMK